MAKSNARPPEAAVSRQAGAGDGEDGQGNGYEPHSPQGPLRGAEGVHRPRWRGYTAFVLSGGGARGALQVGALRALLEAGERPDVVVGTSIGAWNGAVLASDPTLCGVETMERAWRSAHPIRVLLGMEPRAGSPAQALAAMRALTAVRRLAAGQPSLYSDTGMQQLLGKLVGASTFEELAVPLRVIAADITHGKRVVFDSGHVAPAVLASSAIPGIFPPVRIGDAVYVDGGAVENCGLELALSLGARRIFALDVGYDASPTAMQTWSGAVAAGDERPQARIRRLRMTAPHALASVLDRTTQVMSRYQLDHDLARLPPGIEAHVIRPSTPQGGGALDFDAAPEWIEHGYAFTRTYLANLPAKSLIESAHESTRQR